MRVRARYIDITKAQSWGNCVFKWCVLYSSVYRALIIAMSISRNWFCGVATTLVLSSFIL